MKKHRGINSYYAIKANNLSILLLTLYNLIFLSSCQPIIIGGKQIKTLMEKTETEIVGKVFQNSDIKSYIQYYEIKNKTFKQCSFKNCEWEKVSFENCKFESCKFFSVNFKDANFENSYFSDCNIEKCIINDTDIQTKNCQNIIFLDTKIDGHVKSHFHRNTAMSICLNHTNY